MEKQKKTPYYLIIEITGYVNRKNIPSSNIIRGLYSTQAKAIAELFHIASHLRDEGTIFSIPYTQNRQAPLSEMIHSQTHNGETSLLGYNPDNLQLIELQIRTLTLDISTLIIN